MSDTHLTELERLAALRRDGALTEEEFQREKARLLHDGLPPVRPAPETAPVRRRRGSFFGFLFSLFFIALILIAIWLFVKGRDIDTPAAPDSDTMSASISTSAPAATVTTLSPDQQLRKASEAAFKGQTTLRASENVTYTPKHLIAAPFGPVLISEGKVDNPGHASAGKIAVHYLKPEGDHFTVTKAFLPALESGSFGAVAGTQIRSEFASNPTLETDGGGTWQGYTCSWTTLTELTPDGPVARATVPMVYSNSGATDANPVTIEGKITKIVANASFDVTYGGTRSFVDHYVRKGETYVLDTGRASTMETC
ncbi:SHOCT domain-containing protein [Asticcacaulis sp. BYS171W]|uniref:SHOCT domain-containing protein n=1 Tax=Asticcacaulis aquaticus TaxID=2984212 RepID=A0ABT5HVF0_9CAUL|nr:SHOCT domain-containing protein [Asticcacaulis aquaticus]MDC7684061.1 SHOCT domain-containing protein [Asticcacaulis aquaticus]